MGSVTDWLVLLLHDTVVQRNGRGPMMEGGKSRPQRRQYFALHNLEHVRHRALPGAVVGHVYVVVLGQQPHLADHASHLHPVTFGMIYQNVGSTGTAHGG